MQQDRVLRSGHLHWQLHSVVSTWVQEEAASFLLASKHKALIFEGNNAELVALLNLVLIFECNWAMTKKSFLLRDNLSGLVETVALRDIALV